MGEKGVQILPVFDRSLMCGFAVALNMLKYSKVSAPRQHKMMEHVGKAEDEGLGMKGRTEKYIIGPRHPTRC